LSNDEQTTLPGKLVSALLLSDPDLRDLVEEFVDGLSSRFDELRQASRQQDWDRLTLLAHQLKGAGGSYGYADLSDVALKMEQAFRAHSAEQFAGLMAKLEELTAAARAGLQPD
jgi:HPt (histidine-containing phosphotransfer) domain-containing protein